VRSVWLPASVTGMSINQIRAFPSGAWVAVRQGGASCVPGCQAVLATGCEGGLSTAPHGFFHLIEDLAGGLASAG